jgi:hypothetical protein
MLRHWRSRLAVGAMAVTLASGGATNAFAQPGQPVVTVNANLSVGVSYTPLSAIPAGGATIAATFNGSQIPGTPVPIGALTSVVSLPLPAGAYTVQILWSNGQASPVTSFTLGPPGAPTMRIAAADKDTVVLGWDPPASGGVANYELEAVAVRTGQFLQIPLGPAPGATFRGVPPGLYRVRVRAFNALGAGPYSAYSSDFAVGTIGAGGDLQVALTWNTTVDMDLHAIEPNNVHVHHSRLFGTSARLDFDDTNGFGPENITVAPGFALPGWYRIYVVHNSQDVETTSTIAITLGANSGNPSTTIITRRTRIAAPRTAVLVATVNVLTGEIVEALGTGPNSVVRTPGADMIVEPKTP